MAEQQPFDAAQYKRAQREQWNRDGAAWRRWNPMLDRWYGEVTRLMLDSVGIRPGQRILDIAAGAGEPAISAAERVGPDGYVLATDLSEGIVALAQEEAHGRGLRQVHTRVMDGERLDLPDATFDAVICRLGLMYMPHPLDALREWRRVLRADGRVALVVFSTPDRNDWGAVPAAIIRRHAGLAAPVPGQPGPFSLGAPGRLDALLREAGFEFAVVRAVPVPHRATRAEQFVQVAREAFGGLNTMMAHLPEAAQRAAWDEIALDMRRFESASGFEVGGECLLASASK